jgi:hypothetical protein
MSSLPCTLLRAKDVAAVRIADFVLLDMKQRRCDTRLRRGTVATMDGEKESVCLHVLFIVPAHLPL